MDHFKLTKRNSSFYIEGFPDAIKVIGLNGKVANRLAALWLPFDTI